MRRTGVGLVGATVVGAGAYAAGSSAARHSAQEASQDQQLAQLEAQQQSQATPSMPPPQATSAGLTDEKMEQLRKLADMKKEGILTHEEFEAQKQRLLS
jgi:hypothetical protein